MSQHLQPSVEMLVRLSAVIASRQTDELSKHFNLIATQVDAVQVEEVILQSYLFLGYPIALNVMALWRKKIGPNTSIKSREDRDTWAVRGQEVCGAVYGGQYAELRAHIRRLHPDLEQWMVQEGYGKVLGRSGLSLMERELCIVALLAVLDVPKQLYSHLRGALNVGAHVWQVLRALEIGLEYTEDDVATRGRKTWKALQSRAAVGG
tara:strand:- start:9490 stop:10110 length:621 start_codon:yes stop_codon:yes gene_type:complete